MPGLDATELALANTLKGHVPTGHDRNPHINRCAWPVASTDRQGLKLREHGQHAKVVHL